MDKFLKEISGEFVRHRYFYLVILSLALLMILTLPASKRGADGKEYLRWTHSILYDQDLHLLNNLEAVGGGYKLTPTGYTFERVNIGVPVMWLPFYGAASFFLSESSKDNLYPADTVTQLIWLNFTSWLYPILGGILTVAALRHFFSPYAMGGAIVAILFGTPLLFYMMTFPMSAHPALIFLSSLLLYLWLSHRAIIQSTDQSADLPLAATPQPGFLYYVTIGVVCGWMMMVASYNIVFFLLPGLDLLKNLVSQKNWRRTLQNGLAASLGGFVGFGPQLIVWWTLFGNPFYSPYAGQLFWSEPYLLETLFSTFHGLFFYAPVLLLVIPGLWWWRRKDGWAALSLALSWLMLTYIVSINVAWWAGASFGNRYFLSLTPFFAFGLAAFLQQGKRWAALLAGVCVLWTGGLYLQYLNGVGFTSDSIVYPALELANGQLTIWIKTFTILPHLLANRPWHLVPTAILPILVVALIAISRVLYGWVIINRRSRIKPVDQMIIVGLGLAIFLFIGLSAYRGEQARAALAEAGFYDQPHQVILREVKEVAGKAGLVTRALYHRQTNQPQKAVADLKLASELWKSDAAESASRVYLGPRDTLSQPGFQNLHLDYPGNVRLIGHKILEANPQFLKGEIFWEKVEGPKSKMTITPIVRAYDQYGNLVGHTTVDFPFPAAYIPPGDIFRDTFQIQLEAGSNAWIWLGVTVAENYALPLNAQDQPDTGLITSLNIGRFPEDSHISNGTSSPMAVKPLLLNGNQYQPGQMIPLQLIYQAAEQMAGTITLAFNLFDGADNLVGQEQTSLQPPIYPTTSTHCFRIPDTGLTGDFHLDLKLMPDSTGTLLDDDNQPTNNISIPIHISTSSSSLPIKRSICHQIEADFPRRYEPTSPQNLQALALTENINLVGYDLSIIPQQGSILARVILHWHIQDNVTHHYLSTLQLVDTNGQAIIDHTAIPVHQTRPTSTWLKDEWILDEYILEIPPLAPGDYDLTLSLLDKQTGQAATQTSDQPRLVLENVTVP